jgi:hypothetical protein
MEWSSNQLALGRRKTERGQQSMKSGLPMKNLTMQQMTQ